MKKNKAKKNIHAMILLLLIFFPGLPILASAEEKYASSVSMAGVTEPSDENASTFNNIKNHFSGDFRILTYGVIQEPANTTQNPDNNFIEIPHYMTYLEARPDLRFDSSFLDLSVKPRAKLNYSIWEEGKREGETEWKDDWYITEWLARVKAWDRLFLSYGRENLQWGPSYLFCPSNPFFTDNGRSNPYMEVAGMDFARLVYVPHLFWTISFIANTGEGENVIIGTEPYKKTYAVKMDYTGRQNYASVIVSQKDSRVTGGFFGGLTLTDAILLYGEGKITKGSMALYAKEDEATSTVTIDRIHKDDSNIKPVILAGGSYTFENSGALTLEYMYNDHGYTREEADSYYLLRKKAAAAFESGGPEVLLGKAVLYQTGDTGLKFLRKNYVMLQYYQGNIKNRFEITLRWTQNLDDRSAQYLVLGSCSLGNRWELFSSGLFNAGSDDTEFGSIIDYQVMVGLKFTL
jgi:hypothetical protein